MDLERLRLARAAKPESAEEALRIMVGIVSEAMEELAESMLEITVREDYEPLAVGTAALAGALVTVSMSAGSLALGRGADVEQLVDTLARIVIQIDGHDPFARED